MENDSKYLLTADDLPSRSTYSDWNVCEICDGSGFSKEKDTDSVAKFCARCDGTGAKEW